jgi:hypothetical protein
MAISGLDKKTGYPLTACCGFERNNPRLTGLLFYFKHLATVVRATTGANGVVDVHLATAITLHQVRRSQKVVCTPLVAAGFGFLAFWLRRHFYYSCFFIQYWQGKMATAQYAFLLLYLTRVQVALFGL